MKFTTIEFNGEKKAIYPTGKSSAKIRANPLGEFFVDYLDGIESMKINGNFMDDWHNYLPNDSDDIEIYLKTGFGYGELIAALIISIVSTVLSVVLAPKPKKPSSSKSQPANAVAGIQNTVAPGTPKFITYGTRRVFGHIIASSCDLTDLMNPNTGRSLTYSVMYYMGMGPISCIEDVKINGTFIRDLPSDTGFSFRLGTQTQEIIDGHQFVHQNYTFNNTIPRTPIVYTTKSHKVDRITFFIRFPGGLFSLGKKGTRYAVDESIRVRRKLNTATTWIDLGIYNSLHISTENDFFWRIAFDNPSQGQWDYEITGMTSNSSGPILLFNVQETTYVSTAYPGCALLEVHGIANEQITSIDNMQASALVDGRLVDVLQNGIYVKQFSRNRVWIVRDLMLNSEVGLGNRIDASMWDNAAGLEAANYYDTLVPDFNDVLEARDYCDIILSDTRPGTDHIKTLLFEGRAMLLPSGGKYKYVIDRDRPFNVKYSEPGNILTGTLQVERGTIEKPINVLRAEFPDETQDFRMVPAKLEAASKLSTDPENPETISYTSLVRKSNVAREMNFYLKKQTLIKYRWNWKAPRGAVTSEPLDIDKLSYSVPKRLRGYTGFIKGSDGDSSTIVTGQDLYLAAGATYTTHVRHQNTTEERYISNSLGQTHSIIHVTSPFSFTPRTGDIWSVGRENIDVRLIQTDEVELNKNEVTMKVHEHIPGIYDDELNDVTALENASATSSSPSPLLGFQAQRLVISGVTVMNFNVIPGYSPLSGVYSVISGTTIALSTDEPIIEDLFTNAFITTDISPIPQLITDYNGVTKVATVQTPFPADTNTPGNYFINWTGKSAFEGFLVQGSFSTAGPWSAIGITPSNISGTSLTTVLDTPGTYSFFRATPYSASGTQNTIGRHIIGITTNTIRPLPPAVVDIISDSSKRARIIARLNTPLERDLHWLIAEFREGSITGATLTADTYIDVSGYRDDTKTDAVIQTLTKSVASLDYGDSVFGTVATIDFFGNKAIRNVSFFGTTLSGNEDIPDEVTLDDNQDIRIYTGALTHTLFTRSLAGGLIGTEDHVRYDAHFLVTPSTPGITTTYTFSARYGGTVVGSIPITVVSSSLIIPDRSSQWLSLKLEGNSATNSQAATFQFYGRSVSGISLSTVTNTLGINSLVSQNVDFLLTVAGNTSTILKRRHLLTRQILV